MYYILIAMASLIALIAVVLLIALLRPGAFRISRSAVMDASAEKIFAHVNDFHHWEAWSPWAKMDPKCIYTFQSAAAGQGAIFTWAGNKKVGEGRMTILESDPNKRIRINLEFFKPFPNTTTAEFTFAPRTSDTLVTWTMTGKNKPLAKLFCMVINMDKMIGGDFERGLAALRTLVESETPASS